MIQIENIQGTGHSIPLKRVVIKIGSAVIAGEGANADERALASLADSVVKLREKGVQVLLVSSGAIGMARRQFPDFNPRTIPDRQALAAIGQVGLMHTWKELFNARGFKAAQILLTRDDLDHRRRYLNARNTLERLLQWGAVPIINENDTVTVDELQYGNKFGDNDELSALVATKMNADLLILLSVVDGLYRLEGRAGLKSGADIPQGELIPVVERLDGSVHELADQTQSLLGRGGMAGKLMAIGMAGQAGVHAVIASGKSQGIVDRIVSGEFRGTYFAPRQGRRMTGRDRWIAFGRQTRGRLLIVDDGARVALVTGKKSLLAAGVREVRGEFAPGDVVEVAGPDGVAIARGLVNYHSADLERIKGMKSGQIREILGHLDYEEVIHRNNLCVTQ